MKRSFINFRTLSAKQLITSAAVILMSTITFSALASGIEEDIVMESWMSEPFEMEYEEALSLEDWMTSPFEMEYEEALALEDWMTSPFEMEYEEESGFEICLNTPYKVNPEEKCPTCS